MAFRRRRFRDETSNSRRIGRTDATSQDRYLPVSESADDGIARLIAGGTTCRFIKPESDDASALFLGRPVAVVVPSPARSLVLEATSRTIWETDAPPAPRGRCATGSRRVLGRHRAAPKTSAIPRLAGYNTRCGGCGALTAAPMGSSSAAARSPVEWQP